MSSRSALVDASLVVTRKLAPTTPYLDQVVARADAVLREPLALGGRGRLSVRGAFAKVRTAPVTTWSASGRIHVRGARIARIARVEIEIAEHSADACTIEVRPVSPNVVRWGKWRFNRYFDLAHHAADALAHQLRAAQRTDVTLLAG